MTDIVERLRTVTLPLITHAELREAADDIERLRAAYTSMSEMWKKSNARTLTLQADNERLRAALQEIEQWSLAYPLAVFPKPDLKRAQELLGAGGMTLDVISADAMRHLVESVAEIARRALEPRPA